MSDAMLNQAADKFAHKMWVTKGCRFSAHSRLSKQSSLSNISISLISFYVAAASVVTLIPSMFPSLNGTILSLVTCLASILIIIVSIFENSAEYGRNAIEMYRCAAEINEQYDILRCQQRVETLNREKLEEIVRTYHETLGRYPINHSSADLAKFKLENQKDFSLTGMCKIFERFCLRIESIKPFLMYYAAMLVPVAAMIALLYAW